MTLLGTFIDLPTDTASSTLHYAGAITSDLSVFWIVVAGVILAGVIITVIISALHKH